ncbi:MAG TPA: UDP-N-acetylmuramoyl-L-alanine--D-glutamate ligase [Candidatus Omnitrophica bacterium]|nr:UDP-N-acetylmuramoyl-L-alanine--D-glutamate ligase [Candidatus Omnitrophota bacterium]
MKYKNKKVTVVGLARSGIAAAHLLKSLGAQVSVTEKNASPALEDTAAGLRAEGIAVELGGHSPDFMEGCGLVVISPGVRLDSEPVIWAKGHGIDCIGEIELAAEFCPAPVIAITGTNGKTTTTTLVGEVIKAGGKMAHVAGNIGMPFSSIVSGVHKEDLVSLEVSSFQLEAIKDFHPKISVILNLTPDHLDRYGSMEEYLAAKKRIFLNQGPDDHLVLNYGDEALRNIAEESPAKVVFFNKDASEEGFDQNQMAVLAVAGILGISRQACLEVFRGFKGVEHRMEFVRGLKGIEFINDSKATNIDSTIWALNNIKKPAVLIAGGRDKGSDFFSLARLVKQKIRYAVLVGEASERIAAAWEGILPVERVRTFPEAVQAAYRSAKAGEIVLFSPMCKSFDMFTDYEHRGRTFKELVNQLK